MDPSTTLRTGKPRLRFAPSPTGHLHIGGARTALYNWLVAKKTGGTFLLRIEDTDRSRSTEEYIDSIMEAMKWLKLDWQEGPFQQTDRLEIYKAHVDQLLKEGKAYRCYCTPEELDAKRQLAQKEGRKPKYDGKCKNIDPKLWESDPRPYCIRFKTAQEGSPSFKT
jgi:glutamyl-tRNA synthetase